MKVILRYESEIQCPMCGGGAILVKGKICHNCSGKGVVTINADKDITDDLKKNKQIWNKITSSR